METIIQSAGLTKFYGQHLALDQLQIEVRRGEIFGFLGPNGAGKTTFIKLMLGFIKPSDGSLSILGQSPTKLDRSQIGYLPEKIVIHPFLTGREYLQYQAALNGIPRNQLGVQIDSALKRLEMMEAADRRISTYSKGMVQRIGVANLLLGDRQLLLLDEPNSGLDPIGIALIRKIMSELRDEGRTVFVNSHQLLEVEKACDRVAILNKGRVVAQGSSRELSAARGIRLELAELNAACEQVLKEHDMNCKINGNAVELSIPDAEKERQLPAKLVAAGGRILHYSQSQESLEEVFQRLVQSRDAA
ncbi:MAG: ABC transporter ATP-binding protein [Leptospiraceae bacterium]|nr:ABC transporter ATP-binding protein [Leptospiraceae bacterium]